MKYSLISVLIVCLRTAEFLFERQSFIRTMIPNFHLRPQRPISLFVCIETMCAFETDYHAISVRPFSSCHFWKWCCVVGGRECGRPPQPPVPCGDPGHGGLYVLAHYGGSGTSVLAVHMHPLLCFHSILLFFTCTFFFFYRYPP